MSGGPSPGGKAAREALEMRGRYARRDAQGDARRYSLDDPYAFAAWRERLREVRRMLQSSGLIEGIGMRDMLEIGCGSGRNLQDLLDLGADARRVQGIELLPERAAAARAALPEACRIWSEDALSPQMSRRIAFGSQDLVVLFTVFSSILSDDVQQQLAQRAWQWLKPGGAVLWHDFVYDNPRNADVRGVRIKRVRALFPDASMQVRRITLAPPLGRAACRISPALYPVLGSVSLLRTHVLCLLRKNS
ncbi:MAG: class I SAM-dependent methyltransferase [Burkholderiaceae bacterium]|jgi:SAM-dependent methyltransferase|nr:class I SAM-dependent methyltransferase [Burkholderiaceae bacterium]